MPNDEAVRQALNTIATHHRDLGRDLTRYRGGTSGYDVYVVHAESAAGRALSELFEHNVAVIGYGALKRPRKQP